jgi:hypothetical protein
MGMSALVPVAERPLVYAGAARLERDLGWYAAGTPRDPGLVRRVCFVVTAIAPRLPPDRLAVLARYALWSILLDDRLDAPTPDLAALDRLRHAVAAATRGSPDPGDPLTATLAGIIDELSGRDPSGAAVGRFGAALRDAVAAGVDHARLARAVAAGAAAPTAGRYLAVAARSVNYLSFGYALLALGRVTPPGAVLDRLDLPLRHAARAVRLANDLRGVARDRAAGTLNVLDLRTADGDAVTPRLVARGIARRRLVHDAALRRLTGPDLAAAARTLTRSLRLALDLYRRTDLR